MIIPKRDSVESRNEVFSALSFCCPKNWRRKPAMVFSTPRYSRTAIAYPLHTRRVCPGRRTDRAKESRAAVPNCTVVRTITSSSFVNILADRM